MIRNVSVFIVIAAFAAELSSKPATAEVGRILDSYYSVHQALAGDDLKSARSAAKSLAERAADAGGRAEVITHAKQLANAANIGVARESFQALSKQLLSLTKSTGTDDRDVYVVHCPMAFGGKGGTWLQKEKTVANPYYGSSMLRCGSVTGEVSATETIGSKDMHVEHE